MTATEQPCPDCTRTRLCDTHRRERAAIVADTRPAAPMNNTFTLPASIAEADRLAADLGSLAHATGWKLAALVYARVRVQEQHGRPRTETVNLDLLSPEQFAALEIRGLTSKNTVRAYWRAWHSAIVRGVAQPVRLGDTVTLPDRDFWDFYALAAASAGRHEPLTPPVPDPLAAATEAAAPGPRAPSAATAPTRLRAVLFRGVRAGRQRPQVRA